MAHKQSVQLVFDIPLNNRGLQPADRELNTSWLDHRIAIMCKYTLPSLAEQTCQDFWVMFGVRRETLHYLKHHRMLRKALDSLSMASKTCFTSKPLAMDFRRPDGPLGASDYVLVAHLDSDDVYHPRAVGEMLGSGPFQGAPGKVAFRMQEVIRYARGYFLDDQTQRMHPYVSLRPPFFAQVLRWDDWLNPSVPILRHHANLKHCKRMRVISDKPRFIVTIHGRNKSSRFRGGHWGLLTDGQARRALGEFPSVLRLLKTRRGKKGKKR